MHGAAGIVVFLVVLAAATLAAVLLHDVVVNRRSADAADRERAYESGVRSRSGEKRAGPQVIRGPGVFGVGGTVAGSGFGDAHGGTGGDLRGGFDTGGSDGGGSGDGG